MSFHQVSVILIHTPIWVYVILAGILFLGYIQTKDKIVSPSRAFMLPLLVITLVLWAVLSSFGVRGSIILFYFLGVIFAIIFFGKYLLPAYKYNNTENKYYVQGSLRPLIIKLAIFAIKYYLAFANTLKLTIVNSESFTFCVSFILGICAGAFISRLININHLIKLPAQLSIILLKFYKFFISPLLPMSCRFSPSCSEYSIEAFKKYGFFKGITKTILRLSRCHPFSKHSGWDPP